MGFLKSLGQPYLRWRHSKGFGVHSPFAYNLVMNVVSPGKYGYYGYDEIEAVFPDRMTARERRIRLDARLVLRILVNLGLKRMIIVGESHPSFKKAAESTKVNFKQTSHLSKMNPGKGDLVIIFQEWPKEESFSPSAFLEKGVTILTFDLPLQMDVLPSPPMKTGLCLRDKRIVLWVPNENMAFVDYTVNF